MRMLLKKSKKLLLLVLTLCVLVTCKSDIVFASNSEESTQATELVYNLKTSSYLLWMRPVASPIPYLT